MIKFALKCSDDHRFEAWFKSGAEFDKLQSAGLLTCAVCGTIEVDKALMAPNVGVKANRRTPASVPALRDGPAPSAGRVAEPHVSTPPIAADGAPSAKLAAMVEALRELRTAVTRDADYVGDKFAEEARKVHFQEAPARAIYGNATREQVRELVDDGVEIAPLPSLPEDHN